MEALIGITVKDLYKLMKENDFDIDSKYRSRLKKLFILSLMNSYGKFRERRDYGPEIAAVEVKRPVFIIGHWRSGTTLLHNLFALDQQFAYPNLFQVSKPHQCLRMETIVKEQMKQMKAEKRAMDNMEVAYNDPGEDESAVSVLSQRSPLISWVFPRNRDRYDSYHTFKNVPAEDFERWKKALTYFLKKITLRYQKTLILKSPVHTARVKILKDIYPDAKFVHISRNPYDVFRSSQRLYRKMLPLTCLQEPDFNQWDSYILENYKTMYDAYFDERPLLPDHQLYELKYEELEKDMVGEVEKIYTHFGINGFDTTRKRLEDYVEANKNYEKNNHYLIDNELKARINEAWDKAFKAFGYAKDHH